MTIAVLLLASTAFCAEPAPQKAAIFPKTAFSLPAVQGIRLDWVLAPRGDETKREQAALRFDVDATGSPWFGDGTRRLLVSRGGPFTTAGPFRDFAFLDSGFPLVCTDKYLAAPYTPGDQAPAAAGPAVLQLRALAKLDHADCRLFPGGESHVYLDSRDEAAAKDELTLVDGGNKEGLKARMIMRSDGRLGAVAGDGETTYFALGKVIFKLGAGDKEPAPFFSAREAVTGLTYSPNAGLFYATAKHVGFAAPTFNMTLLTSPDPQIALRGDALYIRLSRTLSVVKVSGASIFKTLQWVERTSAGNGGRHGGE